MRYSYAGHRRHTAGKMVALAVSLLACGAAPAVASSVVYIGSDGNVNLASPDGSLNHQVTHDATPENRYRSPSQTDAGKVVAIRKGGSSGFVYFLDRQSGQVLDNWILPQTGVGSFAPAFGGQISPEGGLFVYDWRFFDCLGGCSGDFRIAFVGGPGQTNPCLINCHTGYVQPRWIPGTAYAGFIDSSSNGITVQTASGPQFWFGISDAQTRGFDVEGDRTLVEFKPSSAPPESPQNLALVQNGGTPPTPPPPILCTVDGFPGQSVRWAPGGNMIAWEGAGGVYVSPTPTETGGGACTLQPKLIAPGGTVPDWGPLDVPTSGGGGVPSTGSGGGTGGPSGGANTGSGRPKRVAPLVGAVTAARSFRQRKGFRFTITLARPARVLVKIETVRPARVLGTVSFRGKARKNRFTVRKVKGKSLRPGRYRATITAIEGTARSTPKRLSFRIRR
jgi:hypothetical protein